MPYKGQNYVKRGGKPSQKTFIPYFAVTEISRSAEISADPGSISAQRKKFVFFFKNFEFLNALEIDPNAYMVQTFMGLLDMFKVLLGPKNFWAEISTYPQKSP